MCKKIFIVLKNTDCNYGCETTTICGIFDALQKAQDYKKELEKLKLNYTDYEIKPFFINDKAFISS